MDSSPNSPRGARDDGAQFVIPADAGISGVDRYICWRDPGAGPGMTVLRGEPVADVADGADQGLVLGAQLGA